MNGFRWMIAATLSASLLVVLAFAQDFPEPPPEEPKKKEVAANSETATENSES